MHKEKGMCLKCRLVVCNPCVPSKCALPEKWIMTASDRELRRRSHHLRLAIATAELGLGRRPLADELALVIYNYDGVVFKPDWSVLEIYDTLIDDIFGGPDFRWLSDHMNFAIYPPRQGPREDMVERFRLIDLYFRIKYPDRAALIAK